MNPKQTCSKLIHRLTLPHLIAMYCMLCIGGAAQAGKTRIYLDVRHAYTMDRPINSRVEVFSGKELLASGWTDIEGKVALKIRPCKLVTVHIVHADTSLMDANFNLFVDGVSVKHTIINVYPKLSILARLSMEQDSLYGPRDAGNLLLHETSELIFGCKKDDFKRAVFAGDYSHSDAYFDAHLSYPGECRDMGIQGKVVLSFVVEMDGRITHLRIERMPHELLAAEAIRVVMDMPWWQPATCDLEPIRSIEKVEIEFILK